MNPAVRKAIASIDEAAWTPIRYPNAVFDDQEQRWISAAEVAKVPFTAFGSQRARDGIDGRLIARRVKRLNPASVPAGQDELLAAHRHHAVFTDSHLTLQAETGHRRHAVIEQVITDLKNGPHAHLPSAKFNANAARLVLATIGFNLLRATGCLTSLFQARATTSALRTQLINIPARLASSARRLTLHLPPTGPGHIGQVDLLCVTLPESSSSVGDYPIWRSNVTRRPSTPPGPRRPLTSPDVTDLSCQPCDPCSFKIF